MPAIDSKVILLTGASGFLGTWLAQACRAAGHRVVGVDRCQPPRDSLWADFCVAPCESVDWEAFLHGIRLNTVFLLAGGAYVPDSIEDPYRDFAALIPGTIKLLCYLARCHPSAHIVFFSSAAVYGNPLSLPINEADPITPISPYGIHKAASEFLLCHYSRLYNLRISILRVFSAFGPGLQKQFFWDFAKRVRQAAALGEKSVTLFGTGRESRDFIYAADIARAAIHVTTIPGGPGCEIFNVGSGRETTIGEASALLVKHIDSGIEVAFNGGFRAGDPLNWRADTRKISSSGFRPEVSLAVGIEQTAGWLTERQTR